MNLEKRKVIERIKEAKSYGLNYSKLAREVGIQPVTLYMFINGTYNLSYERQLKALCIIEKYIEKIQEDLKTINANGVYAKLV